MKLLSLNHQYVTPFPPDKLNHNPTFLHSVENPPGFDSKFKIRIGRHPLQTKTVSVLLRGVFFAEPFTHRLFEQTSRRGRESLKLPERRRRKDYFIHRNSVVLIVVTINQSGLRCSVSGPGPSILNLYNNPA